MNEYDAYQLFYIAAQRKFRFPTDRGLISAEELWDLPLETKKMGGVSLDTVAIALYKQVQETTNSVQSFVHSSAKTDDADALKLALVKHVIAVRIAEKDAATASAAKKAQKAQIMALIEQKNNEALSNQSVDELRKMLQDLN